LTKGINTLTALAQSAAIQQINAALGAEAQLHLVGGCVRDALSGLDSFDVDLAAAFDAARTAELLSAANLRVIETGLQHGTLTVLADGHSFEITTFRNPYTKLPAKRIEDDLLFRDFSINAIAFSVANLKLIDPLGGIEDLKQQTLKATGPASERLSDDPLRTLRAIRFGPASGRILDLELSGAIRITAPKLHSVSVERIREEIKKILLCPQAAEGFRSMKQLGLLEHTIPELIPTIGFEQNEFHIHDVFEHTLWVLERCPLDITLRLAAIFHDIAKPQSFSVGEDGRRHFYRHEELGTDVAQRVMLRLKFSHQEIHDVSTLVRHHMRPINCGPSGVRRLMRDLGPQLEAWKLFKFADGPPIQSDAEVRSGIEAFSSLLHSELERLKGSAVDALAIDGNDLIALGLKPGPRLGTILKELGELVLENPSLNEKETLLKKAQELMSLKTKSA
jgi:tRNA nucleotidyltransferase (CCA-adding enzyme)